MRPTLIVALLLCSLGATAQSEVDSLLQLSKKSTGRHLVDVYNHLAGCYQKSSLDTALYYVEKAFNEGKKIKYTSGIATSWLHRGAVLQAKGKYKEAEESCEQAIELFTQARDHLGIANAHNTLGILHLSQAHFKDASVHFKNALSRYQQLDDQEGLSKAYKSLGNSCMMQGQYDSARQFYLKGSEISERLRDDKLSSSFYTNIGTSYQQQGHQDKALEYYLKSLALKERMNDKYGMASIYNNIGLMYNEQGDYAKALEYHRKVLALDKEIGGPAEIAMDYNNLGNVYISMKAYDSALHYFQISLGMREQLGNKRDIAHTLENIGHVYGQQEKYDQAIAFYKRSIELNESLNDKKRLSLNYAHLGTLYIDMKRYQDAEHFLKESLHIREEIGDYYGTSIPLDALTKLYEATGDYKQSLFFNKRNMAVRDSLTSDSKNKQIMELQTRYETERKEKEIASLKLENAMSTFWQRILAVGLLVLAMLAVGILFFYRYRNRKNRELLAAQQQRAEELIEVDRMKSRFFANISHEFRTPLTLILGPAESLEQDVTREQDRQKLQLIRRNAQRLLKLINQVLDLSKAEAGKLTLRATLHDVVSLSKGIFHSFYSLAWQKNIELEFTCEEQTLHLFLDREKFEQVITNLLSNALKFTMPGDKVSMMLRRSQWSNTECVEILVVDTGTGIAEGQLPYIFDRFFQADASADSEGTGIGLALVKELVHLHHGEVTVESEEGRGTTFHVYLPLGKDHLRDEEIVHVISGQEETSASMDTSFAVDTTTLTDESDDKPVMLIVEDHPDLTQYIKSVFALDYKIEEAANGKEGLAKAIEKVPHIIISDVMMPVMNGFEFCRKVKADIRTSHIPVILLTAKNDEQDKLKGLACEADDYVVKPFSTHELAARVKNLITLRNKLQEKFKSSVMVKPNEVKVNSMEEAFLQKLMHLMEENMANEGFGVEQLSEAMGMSRVHLHRKLQSIMNYTPSTFIRKFRLERAMDMLRQHAGTVAEISYAVGFSSPTYFSKCFTEQYGYPPREVSQGRSV